MTSKLLKDPKPFGPRVLVRRLVPVKSTNQVVLPDSVPERYQAQIAEVVELGNENTYDLKVGDIVIFNKGAGLDVSDLFDGGAKLLVLNQLTDLVCGVSTSALVTPN